MTARIFVLKSRILHALLLPAVTVHSCWETSTHLFLLWFQFLGRVISQPTYSKLTCRVRSPCAWTYIPPLFLHQCLLGQFVYFFVPHFPLSVEWASIIIFMVGFSTGLNELAHSKCKLSCDGAWRVSMHVCSSLSVPRHCYLL